MEGWTTQLTCTSLTGTVNAGRWKNIWLIS